jgi:ribosome-associated translation inhibitor RaiA
MTLIPIQITFRGLAPSQALETQIRQRVAWLEQFYDRITGCRVLVELPHRHHHEGRHCQIRIELTVPAGAPIVVSHEPSLHGALTDVEEEAHHKHSEIEAAHRDARAAIHQAFDAARRRLQDFAREQRGAVKTHESEVTS